MIHKILFIFSTLLFATTTVYASTTITAQVVRNQAGSGETFISSGFPFPPGLVTEQMVTDGKIKVIVNGSEVAANVSALRGRHNEGSVRSALIQFTIPNMTADEVITTNTSVVVDGGVRTYPDPAYVRPTWEIVGNNNVILATSSTYLCSTQLTFQSLTPIGTGSAVEIELYDTMADYRFDQTRALEEGSQASYERERALIGMFARTGNAKYQQEAVKKQIDNDGDMIYTGLRYTTPSTALYGSLAAVMNPDGRPDGGATAAPAEQESPRSYGYAVMYLMTGYRDFWTAVAFLARNNLIDATSQAETIAKINAIPTYDSHRTNYKEVYAHLIPAYCIDATYPVQVWGQGVPPAVDWTDQLEWAVDAIESTKWDIRWLPFSGGTGTAPTADVTVTQGAVTATVKGVYQAIKADPKRYPGEAVSSTGWLMITPPSGGSFTAGALTISGMTATATGPEETDYRNGMTGIMPWSTRVANAGVVTMEITDDTGTPGTTGTLLTATAFADPYTKIEAGANIRTNVGNGIIPGTFVVSQLSGTTGREGTYRISEAQSVSSQTIYALTLVPIFQIEFTNNFLIDYYFNVKADSRIPALVKSNIDVILNNITEMESDDIYYGYTDAIYGPAIYGTPYHLVNPPIGGGGTPYELPEHSRAIAFVYKTLGNATVNGADYPTWYNRVTDGANVSRSIFSSWQWKHFGQFYGWGLDSPWIMAQSSLTGMTAPREPTAYSQLPGDTPELARATGSRYRLRIQE